MRESIASMLAALSNSDVLDLCGRLFRLKFPNERQAEIRPRLSWVRSVN